jgi:hypothetical protein
MEYIFDIMGILYLETLEFYCETWDKTLAYGKNVFFW